uniref:Uncharacterized protein n=1 Tax=Steinernema glaseri TaxID=37863 RepID=A0A1I8A125_9BILA
MRIFYPSGYNGQPEEERRLLEAAEDHTSKLIPMNQWIRGPRVDLGADPTEGMNRRPGEPPGSVSRKLKYFLNSRPPPDIAVHQLLLRHRIGSVVPGKVCTYGALSSPLNLVVSLETRQSVKCHKSDFLSAEQRATSPKKISYLRVDGIAQAGSMNMTNFLYSRHHRAHNLSANMGYECISKCMIREQSVSSFALRKPVRFCFQRGRQRAFFRYIDDVVQFTLFT